MRRATRRTIVAAALVLLPAGGLAAECATYLTTSYEDGPESGELLGTERVTYSLSGGGFGYTGSYSVSYDVGYYQLSNGDVVRLDCRTYREATLL